MHVELCMRSFHLDTSISGVFNKTILVPTNLVKDRWERENRSGSPLLLVVESLITDTLLRVLERTGHVIYYDQQVYEFFVEYPLWSI